MISVNGASCVTDAYYNGTKLTAIYAKCGPSGTPVMVWPSQFTLERNDCYESRTFWFCHNASRACHYLEAMSEGYWRTLSACYYTGIAAYSGYMIDSTSDYRVINHGSETITKWSYEWVSKPSMTASFRVWRYDECGDIDLGVKTCTLDAWYYNPDYQGDSYVGSKSYVDICSCDYSFFRAFREYWPQPLNANQAIYDNLSDGYGRGIWLLSCTDMPTAETVASWYGITPVGTCPLVCNYCFEVCYRCTSAKQFRILAYTSSGTVYQSRVYNFGEDINNITFTPRA